MSLEGSGADFLVRCRREALQASGLNYRPDLSRYGRLCQRLQWGNEVGAGLRDQTMVTGYSGTLLLAADLDMIRRTQHLSLVYL